MELRDRGHGRATEQDHLPVLPSPYVKNKALRCVVMEKKQFSEACLEGISVYLPDDIFSEVYVCGNHNLESVGFPLHKVHKSSCLSMSFDSVCLASGGDESWVI